MPTQKPRKRPAPTRSTRAPSPRPVFEEPTPLWGGRTLRRDPTGYNPPADVRPEDVAEFQQLVAAGAVSFPLSRGNPGDLYELATALGPSGDQQVALIENAGRIVFHAVGDIGATNTGHYQDEVSVADRMTAECQVTKMQDRPAFLYLLGDLIYDFGQAQDYYGQFYEPYRNYAGPILAIPGNHDSFIVPGTPVAAEPLTTFMRNFCALTPQATPEAGSLHRTAMTQPGVYFSLDAPYVRIIGLFSNALEDPGLISSQGGRWGGVPDHQLAFLTAQLQRVKSEKYAGAVLLATHHPPFSFFAESSGSSGSHGCSPDMLAQIDQVCRQVGVYPHAFLAGHAHNYQRYTRTVRFPGAPNDYDVPFIICGDGGHNVISLAYSTPGHPAREPVNGSSVGYLDPNPGVPTPVPLLLNSFDDTDYGYLRVSVDREVLTITYNRAGTGITTPPLVPADVVAVNLASHTLVAG
ncbi:MAG: metallophosphoesterase [Thermoplasmata archaeon]|nr:metallophosphoesterase [Thermoplasmata archaeon]